MLFHFVHKSVYKDSRNICSQLLLRRQTLIRLISTTPNFTVNYLVNSCGLSPQSALKASEQLDLKSAANPDSVLSLFRTHGFTKPQISKLILCRPQVLLAEPDKILKPKLDFFNKIGISLPDLGIYSTARILSASLENRIIPSIHFLTTLLHSDATNSIPLILTRSGFSDALPKMMTNVATLQDHHVPNSNIRKSLVITPRAFYSKADRFNKAVLEIEKLGFNPSSMMYMYGLRVLLEITKPAWETKVAIYRSFGWSGDEVLSMFKKQPKIMASSVKKINLTLEFFMNTLNWSRDDISKNPSVILLSLEKRIIPRCCILQILLSKGLIGKNSIPQALIVAKDVFLKKHVIKYQQELPDLLNVYNSKMG